MEILEQMVADMLRRGEAVLTLSAEAADCLETKALETLGRIRTILANDDLDDPECFERIELIVCELEALGLDCGTRHDFG